MKALVTGGRGFIGSFLVEALLGRGFEVTCLLRQGKAGWLDGLDFHRVDGDLTEASTLVDKLRGFTHVFHLAGLTKAIHREDFYRVNVKGTENLATVVRDSCPELKKFVLISSLAAAGPSPPQKPRNEALGLNPVSHYGRSKAEAEQVVQREFAQMPYTIIRPPAVFGPRDRDAFELFKQAKTGFCLDIAGGPRRGSLVYVHDLVEATILASLSEKTTGQAYFVSYTEPYDWTEITQRIALIFGKKVKRIKLPLVGAYLAALGAEIYRKISGNATYLSLDKFREIKQTHWTCDPGRAMADFGFEPSKLLDDALHETCRWYQDNGWL
jgi:nucleoside-diphosphate-sugar epimerase